MVVIPIIPELRWLRQEDYRFEASLGYMGRPCFSREGKKKKENPNKPNIMNIKNQMQKWKTKQA
jgi:hypothetical protein